MTLRLVRSKLYNVVHEGSICASSESTYLVVNNVDYIYIYAVYMDTLFSYVIYGLFFICILFDVIVFNTLRVIRVLCSASSMQFPRGRCCPGLAGPGRCATSGSHTGSALCSHSSETMLRPQRLSLA